MVEIAVASSKNNRGNFLRSYVPWIIDDERRTSSDGVTVTLTWWRFKESRKKGEGKKEKKYLRALSGLESVRQWRVLSFNPVYVFISTECKRMRELIHHILIHKLEMRTSSFVFIYRLTTLHFRPHLFE